MYDLILVRFGELSLKGKNKMNFVYQLAKNISQICNIEQTKMQITIDRIFLPYYPNTLEKLNYVFGISSFSPVYKIETDLTNIETKILEYMPSKIGTFKVNARRNWKNFQLNSIELNHHLGGYILKNFANLKVDVKTPDCEVNIEVHSQFSYLFFEKFLGLNGLPVGSSGSVLHLISGGIDSPVAAYQLMKRGVKVNYLAFISPPHTDQKTVDKLEMIVQHLNQYQINSKLYLFNYTQIMNYIGLTSNQAYKIVLMRRSFYRIANQLAKQNHDLAIANGENLAQVASQTMKAMQVIHQASDLPIYQPLLTNDKAETIALAQRIKTFEISTIKACETCELFAPDHPAINPSLAEAQKLEQELNLLNQLEQEAIKNQISLKKFKLEN